MLMCTFGKQLSVIVRLKPIYTVTTQTKYVTAEDGVEMLLCNCDSKDKNCFLLLLLLWLVWIGLQQTVISYQVEKDILPFFNCMVKVYHKSIICGMGSAYHVTPYHIE